MRTLAVLVCLFGVGSALTITPEGYYDTRYNHLDIERILNNKRLVNYYAMCLLGQGPCTPQGIEFKRILPEALRTNCARCTEKQKITTYNAIRRLKKEYPKIWAQLQVEWDPTGQYVSTFVNSVEKGTRSTETTTAAPQPGILRNRFGVENEISSSSLSTDNEIPKSTPSVVEPQQSTTETVRVTCTTERLATESPSTTTQPVVSSSTTQKVTGSTSNPFRLRITFPKPINLLESISDIGSKVIRTGARIADMVLSSVQATLGTSPRNS